MNFNVLEEIKDLNVNEHPQKTVKTNHRLRRHLYASEIDQPCQRAIIKLLTNLFNGMFDLKIQSTKRASER